MAIKEDVALAIWISFLYVSQIFDITELEAVFLFIVDDTIVIFQKDKCGKPFA